jgi:AcrR family transcriptional regulator
MTLPPAPRRTTNARTQGRSARVIDSVLRATLEELGRAGYGALRVEEVATASGVNKTTIYRRWPTKPALVAAALRCFVEPIEAPDTGTIREDLLVMLRRTVARMTSPTGRGVWRALVAERVDPEVEAVMKELRREQQAQRVAVVRRAVDRGELPAGTQVELIAEVVQSALHGRLKIEEDPLDEAFLEGLVGLLLAGARALASRQA